MGFSEVIGHDRQVSILMRGVVSGQLPPAYLFHGDEGIGKLLTAVCFAKALNCAAPPAPGDFCGRCHACLNIGSGCHPNVAVVGLEENEKTGKMRQEIVIDQIRAAQDFLSLKAVGGGGKVLIVDGAHLMNENTANAFLKTLEEPPDNSRVVLVTSRPGFLLPTIISRCRAMSFQPLGEDLLADALVGRTGMDRDAAGFVARMSGGRLGEALSADADELAGRREGFLEVLSSLAGEGVLNVLDRAEEAASKDGTLDDFVHFGTLWFRDLLLILVGGGKLLAYNRDMSAELDLWAARTTAYRCEVALELLGQARRALERTFNRRLLAEDMFFRLRKDVLAKPAQ